ncbi:MULTISPECIES: hypothetical protein [Sphingobacterium]|uniref:hypothetical protein n=1 Tax=Sphingobacterium TaxID=28453 RepID=UPI000DB66D1D|nr:MULTISPECIES: hypothetical protein [Sphingobacterium]PZU18240.1 MAG: hypothetical protein DI622_10080 [Chryseobacterium sp.]
MKSLISFLFILISVQAYSQTEYTFGDDMMDFVKKDAYKLSYDQLTPDFTGRSLNGFQITLDKARDNANKTYVVLSDASNQLNKNITLINVLKNSLSNPNSTLSVSQIAELASAVSFTKELCFKLIQQQEMTKVSIQNLKSLDKTLDWVSFKNLQLDKVPYFFIMNSIGGTKPDFQMSISLSVSQTEGGQENENSANMGFFLFDLYRSYVDDKNYKKQAKKYQEALNLLPSKLPADTTCFRIYKTTFESVKKLYQEEHNNLKSHVDSLDQNINSAYIALQNYKEFFETSLLDDRVKSGFKSLNLNSFSPESSYYISKRAREIMQSRTYVTNLKNQVLYTGKSLGTSITLDNMMEICKNMTEVINNTKTEPLYLALTNYLDNHLKFFKDNQTFAENLLKNNSETENKAQNKMSISDNLLFSLENEQILLEEISYTQINNLKLMSYYDDGLSLALKWPYSSGSMPVQENYATSGSGVWERGTDGAFIRDSRNPGQGQIGKTRTNLMERTKEVEKNSAEARQIAFSNQAVRNTEIIKQNLKVAEVNKNIKISKTALPKVKLEFDLPTHRWDVLSSVEDRLISPGSINKQIDWEENQTKEFLKSETVLWKPGEKDQYQKKSEEYLKYAKALELATFEGLSKAMLTAATTMRLDKGGYLKETPNLPAFDIPFIPYLPYVPLDVKRISERSLNYSIIDEKLGDKCLWFKAATLVTSAGELGLIETVEDINNNLGNIFSFHPALHFLKGGNEFLYAGNIQNGTAIINGELTGSFTTPNGKTIMLDGLTGKQLDYALIEFEQSKVQEYIGVFRDKNPNINMISIFAVINSSMQHTLRKEVIKKAMFVGFNFADYNDRVKLGQRIIDILYENKQKELIHQNN